MPDNYYSEVNENGVVTPLRDLAAFPRSEQAVLGARNFDPINNLKTEITQQGVKYTPVHDSDGSLQYVIINRESAGTQQAYPDFTLNQRLKAGRYKLSCPMEGGEWGLDKMRYYIRYGSSTYVTKDSDADPIFTLTEDTTINFTSVRVEAGYSPSNVKVYPMILLADDSYTGYSPYAMTNKELTEKKLDKALAVVSGVSFNTLTETGFYACNGNMTDNPGFNYGWLQVYNNGAGAVKQIFYPIDNADIILSRRLNATWSSWYKFTGTEVS